jgi:hypothetical protein
MVYAKRVITVGKELIHLLLKIIIKLVTFVQPVVSVRPTTLRLLMQEPRSLKIVYLALTILTLDKHQWLLVEHAHQVNIAEVQTSRLHLVIAVLDTTAQVERVLLPKPYLNLVIIQE